MVPNRRSGFTLLETSVALVLLVVVGGNIYSVVKQSSIALGARRVGVDLDTQARRTMDRITMAIIGASADSLWLPQSEPDSTPSLSYTTNLGIQNGVMTQSDPMSIEFHDGTVSWSENSGTPNEKHVIWTKDVPELRDGEVANGVDDNDNGIRDETGLAFVKDGKRVTVYLTIRRTMANGEVLTKSLCDTVTCRN